MALLKYGDRVREVTDTVGTVAYNLNGTSDPLEQTFVAAIGDTQWCYYCCEDVNDWEIGYGQITAGTPDTLSRDTILGSSNSGNKVSWGAGDKTIFNTATAAALDHIAGFAINESDISFNRKKFVATASQTDFDMIYFRGSLEVYVDGLLQDEETYTAIDGATVILPAMTGGEIVEMIAIGQYTTTHTNFDPVPTGGVFRSGNITGNEWRDDVAANDAALANVTRGVGHTNINGDSAVLNGTSSTVDVGGVVLDHSAAFTISFFYTTASTLADGTLMDNQALADSDGYLRFDINAAGTGEVVILDSGDSPQSITSAIVVDTTYHFVIRYNGADLTLWKDGVSETPLTVTPKTTTGPNNLHFGYQGTPSALNYADGEIFGINVWASSLSDAQIAEIFSELAGPNPGDLLAVAVPGGSVATVEDVVALVIALG